MPTGQKNKIFQPMFAFPMVSVGALLIIFLLYYFPTTERQEAALNSRAFRSLAAVSDSLQGRVGAYIQVLEQAGKKQNHELFSRYLAEQVPDLTAGKFDDPLTCNEGPVTVSTRLDKDGAYLLQFRCGNSFAEISLEQILAPYLRGAPDQIFDEIVLTDAQGVVLFQTKKTGSRISVLPSPSPGPASSADTKSIPSAAPAAAFAGTGEFSNLWPISVAGAPYKLYAVPVTIKLTNGNVSSTRLVLGGLLRNSRIRAASMSIPGTALVALILLFLTIAVATWPLLKFKYIRATDRIPRRSAVYFFLSTLATIILVCILSIHLRYIFDLRDVDSNLTTLASAIERNFDGELRQSLKVLSLANRSEAFKEAFTKLEQERKCTLPERPADPGLSSQTGILEGSNPQFGDYPYFDRIFWTNRSGNQKIKWEVASELTPATLIKDRVYFKETLANRLWRLSDLDARDNPFRVDPIVSRNTGEYRAVISQRVPDNSECGGSSLAVVSMVTSLLSLINPVMPPEYGFAVVDESGAVQFHSDSTKNGRENFLNELDDATDLRVALFARQGTKLNAQYDGGNYRVYVKPMLSIQDCPWSLIVFHSSSEDSILTLERISMFGWLTLVYYVMIVILLMLLPHAGRPPTWVWPDQRKRGDYLLLTIVLASIAPAFYFLIFRMGTSLSILLVAFFIPVLSIGVGILKLQSRTKIIVGLAPVIALIGLLRLLLTHQDSNPVSSLLCFLWIAIALILLAIPSLPELLGRLKRPSFENSFAALCALMLMLTGVLPCVAFFKVAYDYHENLLTRSEQIQTVAALAAREERVKLQYAGLKLMPEKDSTQTDVGKWLFVRRRLEDVTDRYDTEFLNLASGQLFTRESAQDSNGYCDDVLPDELVALASIIPSSGGTLTRNLSAPISEHSKWTWCREASNRLRLRLRSRINDADQIAYSLPPTRALLKSVTDDPNFLYPDLVSNLPILNRWALYMAGPVFALAFLITARWIKPTLKKMFLMKIERLEPFPEFSLEASTPISENLILLGFEDSTAAKALHERSDVAVIDFDNIAAGAHVNFAKIKTPIVAIHHFDRNFGDAEADGKRLNLLEKLVAQDPPVHTVIVTTVDPIYLFGAGPDLGNQESQEALASGSDLPRWWRVLLHFKRMRSSGSQSCETIEQGRLIWSSCSTAERVALYQLAHDGWVNPKNKAALDHLQLRGLIKDIPFRFDDDGLRHFVSSAVSAEDRKAWENKDVASLWEGIRLTIIVIGISLLAAFLFFNQQSALGYVLSGLGILTPVTKLLSEAQSFRSLLGLKGEVAK